MFLTINESLSSLPPWLHVLIISALPIIELRGALPYGVLLMKMSYAQVIPLCIIGNLLPAPVILLLAKKVLDAMGRSKIAFFVRISTWIKQRSLKRSEKIEKATFWGLVLFVGIPIPGTGVWTGCLIASLLELSPLKSFLAAALGVLLAAAIVTVLVMGGLMLA